MAVFRFKGGALLCFLFILGFEFSSCEELAKINGTVVNSSRERSYEHGNLTSRTQNSAVVETLNTDNTPKKISKHVEKFSNTSSKSHYIRSELNIENNLNMIFKILQKVQNKKCVEDATYIIESIKNKEMWAMQIFDSLPKFPVGLMYGNMYQLGNFEECTSSKHGKEIKGQYCLADIVYKFKKNHTGFVQPFVNEHKNTRGIFNSSVIHWAMCLPSSCNPEDAQFMLHDFFSTFIDFHTLDVLIEDNNCYYEKEKDISSGEIIYASIISLFLVLILLATAVHIWHIKKRRERLPYNTYTINSTREEAKISTFTEITLSFSLIQTVGKFLQTRPNELNLECICGIKVLSMIFIIAGHSLIFIFGSPLSNANFVNNMMVRVENSIFLNSPLMADSFLLVSGFLMCRLLLIELEKRNGKINIFILYIARYIRLTPAYLIVIGFYLTWLPNLGSGPLWKSVMETESMRCQASWWTNLLYVNNYVQTDKLCMFQAWYLAADYHLFIIAPLLIFPMWKWPKAGLSILMVVTIAGTVLPGFITYFYNLDPTFLAFPPEIEDISTNFYFVNAYIKTHMRAGAYFLGMLFGFLVDLLQKNSIKIPNKTIWMGWFFAAIFGICSMSSIVLFMDAENAYDTLAIAIYTPLHRLAWSLALGWVILQCVTENAGIINKFLSWKLFMPLSRLTYCAYLVNGAVLLCQKGIIKEAISWTKLQLMFTVFGHLITTFMFAFVLCICFESPIHGLEKILLRRKQPYSRKPDPPHVSTNRGRE